MTLDLEDLLAGWDRRAGEICARIVIGRDGSELVQLRVDLGVMQMLPDGRPDGQRYHGLPSALDYARHERQLGPGELPDEDWRELERELHQVNYRRLALASMAEEALERNDAEAAAGHLARALRDVDLCLEYIRFAVEEDGGFNPSSLALQPTLAFHRGRIKSQLRVAEERFEEAVEAAADGAAELADVLGELGFDGEQCEEDPGVMFLRDLERRLRREYGVGETLRERLAQAIEREDFEAAAELRDELEQREDA